ncbi:dinitrogenase iron-molybdenum cofactor biosynthesis protein [bacterium]|nr:dinitrogenase iron-molybdenum cofactor biosynthesis protein [bacterium]
MNKNNEIIKVCVPSEGENLKSEIDSRFGRCKYFMIVEIKKGKILSTKAIKNNGAEFGGGAGMAAAEQVSKSGAEFLITYDVGPKAQSVLNQLGVKIIKKSGNIKIALEEFMKSNS